MGCIGMHPILLIKSRLTEVLCCFEAQTLYNVLDRPKGNLLSGQSYLFMTRPLRWCAGFPFYNLFVFFLSAERTGERVNLQ